MMPPDMLDKESSSSRCRGGSEHRYEVGSFGYRVHHYHDCIVTRGFWEFHNEIHADRIPGSVRDGEWVEFSNRGLPLGFCPDAEVTGRDVLPYVPGHLRPPVVPGHKFQSFPPPWVPSYAGIVTEGHNLLS